MKKIILFFATLFLLSACNKEQKTAIKLLGKWQIYELKWANGDNVDVLSNKQSIEFLSCDQAYTSSCKGVYFVDYADSTIKDLKDTFKFEIKNDEISVSSIKNSNPSNTFVTKILRQRYTIETLDKDKLELKRFRTFADSSNGSLKANQSD